MRFNIQKKVEEKLHEFSKQYLAEKIENIIFDAINKWDKVAFYGGGKSLSELEKISSFDDIQYVIDRAEIEDKRYCSLQDALLKNLNCIIILPWYSRSDIRYELHQCGYEGTIIDIYECLKNEGIHLVVPWYDYSDSDAENKSYCLGDYDIEFYLVDAFEIFQFRYLYQKLLEKGIKTGFIAEPNEINISKDWFDFDTAMKILEENNYNYSIVCNPDAKYAITTQRCEMLDKYSGTKIWYAYGNPMNTKAFGNSEEAIWGFDYSLVVGEWSKKVLEKYANTTQIVCMGYPKYIDYFKYGVDKNSVLNELNIFTEKSILIYLPTWGEWSSIELFSEKIEVLKKDYFVITKPHHCTARLDSEKNNRKMLEKCSDLVLDGNYDFTKAITIGDVFICDAMSGCATETIYLKSDARALFVNACADDLLFPDVHDLAKVINAPDDLLPEFEKKIKIPRTRDTKLKEIFGEANDKALENVIRIFVEENEC